MNLLRLPFLLVDFCSFSFGGGKPPVMGVPPPAAKNSTEQTRYSVAQSTPKNGRASTILSPRFRNQGTPGKATILGSPL